MKMSKRKQADLSNVPCNGVLSSRAAVQRSCFKKDPHEKCTACLAMRPRNRKLARDKNEENRYGSVSNDIFHATAKGQKMKEELTNIINMKLPMKYQNNKKMLNVPGSENTAAAISYKDFLDTWNKNKPNVHKEILPENVIEISDGSDAEDHQDDLARFVVEAGKEPDYQIQDSLRDMNILRENERLVTEVSSRLDMQPTELADTNNQKYDYENHNHYVNHSAQENEDGLSDLWKQMNLAFEYSKDLDPAPIEVNVTKEMECSHEFVYRDNLGLVCERCALVGDAAESIFDFDWSKVRKRHKASEGDDEEQKEVFNETDVIPKYSNSEKTEKFTVRNLVLHPMLEDRMHKHQRDGFDFLKKNLITEKPGGCIIAHAPGTGKTFLAASFIHTLLTQYPEERPLVVTPKQVLCSWMKELNDWQIEEVPVYNLYDVNTRLETTRSNQLEILKKWKENKSILLVSYAQFSSIVSEKPEKQHVSAGQQSRQILLECPGLLVLDEAHFPRNKTTHILNALMQVQTRCRILLSGTLFQNNITELFTLLRLARPDILEEQSFRAILNRIASSEKYPKLTSKRVSFDQDDKILCGELESCLQSDSEELRALAIKDLREVVSPFVNYYEGDVLNSLPGLTDFAVILRLNKSQKDAIANMKHLALPRMSKQIKEAAICMHPALHKIHTEKGNNPLDWLDSDIGGDIVADPETGVKTKFIMDLLSLCEFNGEKLLVFSQFLAPIALLENMIVNRKKWIKGVEIFRLDGNTMNEAREVIISKFNKSREARVLFASIRACGEGIDLTGASRVVLLDIQWNPSMTRQAISRAFRIGQQKPVYSYRLVAADSYEEDIFRSAFDKAVLSKWIFDRHDYSRDKSSLMWEVQDFEGEDDFFQSGSLKRNIQTLYKLRVII